MKSIILVIFFFSAREIQRISCELPKHDKPCEPDVEQNGHNTVVAKPMWDHLSDYPPHLWPKEVEEEYSCEAIIPKTKPTTIPPKIDYPPSVIDDSEEDPTDDFPSVVAMPLIPGLPNLPPHMQPNEATVEPPPPEVPEQVSVKPKEAQSAPAEPIVTSPEPQILEPLPPSAIIMDIISSPHDKTQIVPNVTTNSGPKLSGKISAFPAENATNTEQENEDRKDRVNENNPIQDIHDRHKNQKINNSNPVEHNENTENNTEIQETTTLKTIEDKQIKDSKVKKEKNNPETQERTNPKNIEEKKDNTRTDGKNVEKSEKRNSVEKSNITEKAEEISETLEGTTPINNEDSNKNENSTENINNNERKSEILESTTAKISTNNKNENKDDVDNKSQNGNNGNNAENTERKTENQESTTTNTIQDNTTNKNEETTENTTLKSKTSDNNVDTTTAKTSKKISNNKDENLDSKNRNANGNNLENTERKTENQESTTPNTIQDNATNKNEESRENTTPKSTKTRDSNVEKQEENGSTGTNASERSESDMTKNENTVNGQKDSNSGFGSDPFSGQNPPPEGGGGSFFGKVLKTGGGIIGGGTVTGGIFLGGTAVAGGKGVVDSGTAIGGTVMSGIGGGGSSGAGAGGSSTIPEAGEGPLNPSRNGEPSSNNGRSGNERTQQKSNSNKNEKNSKRDKQEKDGKSEDDDIDFDLDEIDEDLFLDNNKFAVEQHTADNISAIFVEKIKRVDYTCDWFITNFTNEVNNLTIFRDKYDGMVAYAAQAPKRLGDKLETEIDNQIYNRKIGVFNAAIFLENYLTSLREDISTVSSNLNSFIFYTDQLWNQSHSMQTEIVKEILSATSFNHHIYKDIGKARLVAQVSKLRLVDCFSSALSTYQNWRIFMKEIFLKAITMERITYTYLIGKYYNDIGKWDEAYKTVVTFVNDAKNQTNEVLSNFINLRDNTEECVYNITTYVYKRRFKILNTIKEHLIY